MRIVCPSCLKINNIPKKDEYKKANCGGCKNSLLENNLIDASEQNFDEIVVNSDIPVIIDFWAPWCGPCKMMGPVFKETSNEYALKALFVKVNTENEQQLGARFGIRSIPTLIVMKDGTEVERISGAMDKSNLKRLVDRYI